MIGLVTTPIIQAWDSSLPVGGSDLHELVEPLVDAARHLAENATNTSTAPVSSYIELAKGIRRSMADATPGETADDVVDEMLVTLKVLILAARLGHRGIMDLIDKHWEPRRQAAAKGDSLELLHIDIQSTAVGDEPSSSSIPFPTLLATVDPGVASLQEYFDQFNQESETQIQQRFAAMWVIVFCAEWEFNYRKRLAAAHGCRDVDVRSGLMQELTRFRNDYAHHRGIAGKSQKSNKRLKWFTRGDRMQPKQAHYEQLLREFEAERSVFVAAPEQTSEERVKPDGRVPKDLADRFIERLKELSRTPDRALEEAVQYWLDNNE